MARGPCCGLSLERGSQFFAIFDIISGLVAFLSFSYIFIKGEPTGTYFHSSANIPREVVITVIFCGVFNSFTGLILYFVAGFRTRVGCFIWLAICFPFALMTLNPIKIYESVVVYQLAEEIKKERMNKVWTSVDGCS